MSSNLYQIYQRVIEFNPSWNFQRYFRKKGVCYGNIRDIYGCVASAIGAPSRNGRNDLHCERALYLLPTTSPISCISLVKLPRNCQVQSALARLITTLFRSCPALIIPFSVKIPDSIYSRIYIRTDDFKFYLKFYLILLLYWYNFIEWKSIFRSIYWQKNRKITMIYLL